MTAEASKLLRAGLLLGLGLTLLFVWRFQDPARSRPPVAGASREAPRLAGPEPPASPPAWSRRDPFRYADHKPEVGLRPARPAPPVAQVQKTVVEQRAQLRVTGFLRKAGMLKAVLAVDGEVFLVGAGDRAGSLEVLSVDIDQGVLVRAEGGETQLVAPPAGPGAGPRATP
jgi:hypothetical protein